MQYFKNYFNATGLKIGALNPSALVKFCGKITMFLVPGDAWEEAMRPEKPASMIALPMA
jgi:hypothetical protein